MKKTIFTICSIALVCCAIIFACKKEDNSATHVGYAPQMGTGTNPDPNHNSTSGVTTSGTTTSGTTTSNTTTPTVYSVTLTTTSGPLTGTISSSSCGGTGMYGTCSNTQIGTISVSFASAPSSGTYNVVASNQVSGECLVSYNGNYASGGTVTITVVGGKNVATLNNVTGTNPSAFTLAGKFSCP